MKIIHIVVVAVILGVVATRGLNNENESPNEYLPPQEGPGNAPVEAEEPAPAHNLGNDGYQYKTVRRIRYRHRRQAPEMPQNDYLPPQEGSGNAPPDAEEPGPAHSLGNDGYQYKTVRRIRYRHRRQAPEMPQNDYLPPQEGSGNAPPDAEEPGPAHSLGNDGYQYKTVRRIRYRHRRQAPDMPQNDYLPPQEGSGNAPPDAEEPGPAHSLGNDGYQYKTVRRIRYRHRRQAPEMPQNDYLPPQEGSGNAPPDAEEPGPAHSLGNDGYQYKTVRRIRYRHRRQAPEMPQNDYLPPQEGSGNAPPDAEEPGPAHSLGNDGYQYKTVRRIRYRHRRQAPEMPQNDYLPPQEGSGNAPADAEEPAPAHSLGNDGYQYKTVRRIRYRHRRQAPEMPQNDYLPPQEGSGNAPADAEEPAPAHSLGNDGYQYKTVRRIRYRHRRQAPETPQNDYLPPQEGSGNAPPDAEEPGPAHSLGNDGYQYKTVRRIRYRHRRQAPEMPQNDYLPPQEGSGNAPADAEEPAPAHSLGNDGYQYKTVRRIRYRHRRQAPEMPQNDYLPPQEGSGNAPADAEEPAPAHSLGNDGYQYKTVRRIRYRHRRQAPETPQNNYLTPQEGSGNAPADAEEPAPAHNLGNDGYQYKTIRRIRYRHRREAL